MFSRQKTHQFQSFISLNENERTAEQRSEHGQSLMELAVCMTFLLTVLVGIVNVGHMALELINMRDLAQEAAVFAAVNPRSCSDIQGRALPYGQDTSYQVTVLINGKECAQAMASDACANRTAEVKITNPDYPIFVPFISIFTGGQTIPLTASAKSTIINPNCP